MLSVGPSRHRTEEAQDSTYKHFHTSRTINQKKEKTAKIVRHTDSLACHHDIVLHYASYDGMDY